MELAVAYIGLLGGLWRAWLHRSDVPTKLGRPPVALASMEPPVYPPSDRPTSRAGMARLPGGSAGQ